MMHIRNARDVQMIEKILGLGGRSIGLGLMLCPIAGPAAAQQPAANKNWTPPKTPWGEPDLQGIWPLNHLIATPFQRPERFGNRRLMTDDEYAAAQNGAKARNRRFESGAIPQADSGTDVLRITSLMSEPE